MKEIDSTKECQENSELTKTYNLKNFLIELFFGKDNYKNILKFLSVSEKNAFKVIKKLYNKISKKNNNIVKNSTKTFNESGRFYSSLTKLDFDKDLSEIISILLKLYYKNCIIYVDYRTNFYIKNINLLNYAEKIPEEYNFLNFLEKEICNLIKEIEKNRINILANKPIYSIKDKIENFFYRIISYICLNEKKEMNRFKLFLITYFKFYFIYNESLSFAKILDELINFSKEVHIPKKYRISEIELSQIEFLNLLKCGKGSIKDSRFNEKIKSIEIFYVNSSENPEIKNIPLELKNQIIGAYYRAIYLSGYKYKGKDLKSYFENYRKSEFILTMFELINLFKEKKINYECLYGSINNTISRFFTDFELKDFYTKKINYDFFEEKELIDSYSLETENIFISYILKELLIEKNNIFSLRKKISEKRIKNILRKCKSYVLRKKKYNKIFENTGIKRDIIDIINYLYNIYFFSNQGNKKEFVEKLKKLQKLEKNISIKHININI